MFNISAARIVRVREQSFIANRAVVRTTARPSTPAPTGNKKGNK
ncbi:hypothetical protein OAA64_01570 [bacterium]|nr:hypothetical protein [bacterium]